MSESCSLLAGFHRLSLFNAEKAGAANPCGEWAIQESFDMLVPDPVRGFQQNPGG